jgi:ubiquinone/menaquinone biosynthesis C-methylase UbiE
VYSEDRAVATIASEERLYAPEQAIRERLLPWLQGRSMLDVGVGAGRTTIHFAPSVARYVGIDVSAPMIDACATRLVAAFPHAAFAVEDARDLGRFGDASFDFVLFSWNGLDCIESLEDRFRALRELRRVCDPAGYVCFSSHNIGFVPELFGLRPYERTTPRAVAKAIAWQVLLRILNGSGRKIASSPRALLRDGQFDFRLRVHYLRPSVQLAELRACGFGPAELYGMDGRQLAEEDADSATDVSLYFLASPIPR